MRKIVLHGSWTELVLLTASSVVLYQLNIFFLFLVPLQVLYLRRGSRDFLVSAAIILAVITGIGLFRMRDLGDPSLKGTLVLLEFTLPAVFLAGLYIVNADIPGITRRLFKCLAATIGVGAISVPLILLFARSENLSAVFRAQIESVAMILSGVAEQSGTDSISLINAALDPDRLVLAIREILYKNYMFVYFTVLAGCVRLADMSYSRSTGVVRFSISSFKVPDRFVWFLLIPWAGILLDSIRPLGALGYVFWNAGFILLAVFGAQGFGIIMHLLEKRGASRSLKRMISVLVFVFLLWPGINYLVLIGLPGLGVSELWIHYRKPVEE